MWWKNWTLVYVCVFVC